MRDSWRRFIWDNRFLWLAGLLLAAFGFWCFRASRPLPVPVKSTSASTGDLDLAKRRSLQQAWPSIQAGMTKRQVEEILGPPESTARSSDSTSFRWVDADGNVFVVWLLDDKDGTVFGKNRRLVGRDWEVGFEENPAAPQGRAVPGDKTPE